jgi:hypothetical protein
MLHAIELPPSGGDRSCRYDRSHMPAEQKRMVSTLRVVHSLEYMRVSTNDRPLK